MRTLLCLFIVICFALSGCTRVDVYTFKKERVDQKTEGNGGYIIGQKPNVEKERNLKRTLFGVDVEMVGSSKGDEGTAVNTPAKKSETVKEIKGSDEPVTVRTVPAPIKNTEEDWIK